MDDGAQLVDPDGVLPRVGFLKVPEGKVVKNRMHFDLQVSGGRHLPAEQREVAIRAHVARLLERGRDDHRRGARGRSARPRR